MATQQNEGGVPFAIAHDFKSFRLLELPPELVELVEAPNPPQLFIKSEAPASALQTRASSAKAAYAVLCTPNKTFQLRQVQTSNSVFITEPALQAHDNEIPTPTTRAIASCTATLELHPSQNSAIEHLEQNLPLYDNVDGEVDAAGNGKGKPSIFSHIPLSEGECEQAWVELMAFEFAGSSYRPSVGTVSRVWQSINAIALAEGVELDKQFLFEDLSKPVAEEGYPGELVHAILRGLSPKDQDTTGSWTCLDSTKTVSFVGKSLLGAKQDGSDYLTAVFLDTWKEHLPESWRDVAELNTIDGIYELPSSTTIRLKTKAAAANAEGAANKAGSSSRKWHEKFGRARQR